ncbi:hypothetical protein Nepgr_032297 [Nepenthes gracilis]|uniref:Uncharacterized protein n=1 Tax=Nepenthes gracilis TaxID=150966 RepID=A0AAD3TJU5_NEPGR|nr:hypothetical protein Nepgr_032297 [Nepenthes gracilis]
MKELQQTNAHEFKITKQLRPISQRQSLRKNREEALREKISRNNSDQMKQASQVHGKPYSEFRRAREVRLKSAGQSVHSHSTRNSPSQITPPN